MCIDTAPIIGQGHKQPCFTENSNKYCCIGAQLGRAERGVQSGLYRLKYGFPSKEWDSIHRVLNAHSMYSTGTWTQTSFDTSHMQGPGLNLKRWSHLHHWHIRNWQGITMDSVLELMFTWEVISIGTLLCLLFKLTSTTTIIKSMIESYVTLLSQELEQMWHFGLVTFYYLIHKNSTLFLLAVNQETTYFAFLLTLKWGLSVSMIIVTPLYNLATSLDFDLNNMNIREFHHL